MICALIFVSSLFIVVLPSTAFFVAPALRSVTNTARFAQVENKDSNFLLREFKIASGEVINPYEVLKCSRKASRQDIRASYIELSRKYHPDGYRHRRSGILPGSCNSLEEVRDQWERIKLSYEILSNPKSRKKYDRHETIANPGKAVQRAAANAALEGFQSLGKGIFGVGVFAFEQMNKKPNSTMQEVIVD